MPKDGCRTELLTGYRRRVSITGKPAFDKEIENDAFTGRPEIAATRLIEEGDVVIAEGSVCTQKKSGEMIDLAFCDVFEMQDGRIIAGPERDQRKQSRAGTCRSTRV